MVEIEATEAYAAWYLALAKREAAAVDRKVKMLQIAGVTLPFPHSSDIKGGRYPFRELRVNSPSIRVFYAFDPARKAVLLIGGDKSGDERFYDRLIPRLRGFGNNTSEL
jgi:hypothetical protein